MCACMLYVLGCLVISPLNCNANSTSTIPPGTLKPSKVPAPSTFWLVVRIGGPMLIVVLCFCAAFICFRGLKGKKPKRKRKMKRTMSIDTEQGDSEIPSDATPKDEDKKFETETEVVKEEKDKETEEDMDKKYAQKREDDKTDTLYGIPDLERQEKDAEKREDDKADTLYGIPDLKRKDFH